MVSEGESMITVAESMTAGQHGAGAGAEDLHPDAQAQGRERATWAYCGVFKPQT